MKINPVFKDDHSGIASKRGKFLNVRTCKPGLEALPFILKMGVRPPQHSNTPGEPRRTHDKLSGKMGKN